MLIAFYIQVQLRTELAMCIYKIYLFTNYYINQFCIFYKISHSTNLFSSSTVLNSYKKQNSFFSCKILQTIKDCF